MLVQQHSRLGATVLSVWRPLLALLALDCVVTVAYCWFGWTALGPKDVPLPLIGTGLALFLGLRNNTAYARWWEARTLWGQIVNESRNLARTLATHYPGPRFLEGRRRLVELQIAWVHALRTGLRREPTDAAVRTMLTADQAEAVDEAANAPYAIQREMADHLTMIERADRPDPIRLEAVNRALNVLADAQGGLERIRNTPMPRQYALFPQIFVAVYCVMLPFGVVGDLRWLTPFGSTLIGFVFLALDAAGRNLEDPFARSVHDVPMSAIARTIEIDLKQAIGRDDEPRPLRPVLGVLR